MEISLKSFKQGDLDWLCSLYALINLRLLTEPNLSRDEAWRDFFFMLRAIEKVEDGDLLCMITMGIDCADFPWLSTKTSGQRLTRCKSGGVPEIEKQTIRCPQGIVVFLEGSGGFSHYSVIRRNDDGSFSLFDSHGYHVAIKDELIFLIRDNERPIEVTASAVFRPEKA